MARIIEYIKIALMNIRGNKGRSFLTMLGIIIGISSVILIVSAGNGFKVGISGQLDELVGGYVQFYADVPEDEADSIMFTNDDLDLIYERVPHVKGATDVWSFGASATAQSTKGTFSVSPMFGNESLQYYDNAPIMRGRYFNQNEARSSSKVCVINERGAKKLYGSTDVIGMEISMSMWGMTEDFMIVGVRKDNDSIAKQMTTGTSADVTMELPLGILEEMFGYYTEEFSSFIVFADSSEYVTEISKQVKSLLEARYNVRGKDYIQAYDMASQVGMISDILNYVTRYEHHAGVRDRADKGDWHQESAGGKDRLDFVSVLDGGSHYHADWRICRHYSGCSGSKGSLQHRIEHGNERYAGSDRSQGRPCGDRIFIAYRHLFWHLSGQKSGEAQPDRGAAARINRI